MFNSNRFRVIKRFYSKSIVPSSNIVIINPVPIIILEDLKDKTYINSYK